MARLSTNHSQRLNNRKPLRTGRYGWWCLIEMWSIEILPIYFNILLLMTYISSILIRNWW